MGFRVESVSASEMILGKGHAELYADLDKTAGRGWLKKPRELVQLQTYFLDPQKPGAMKRKADQHQKEMGRWHEDQSVRGPTDSHTE
jgi:hypothetical protein